MGKNAKSIYTTAELARHLGLSRWSVSRAINNQSGVSEVTKEHVRTAMEQFGFVPSPHGRGLRGHRTGAIGICFRELSTAVTIQKIAAIQRLLSRRGYRPLFEFAEMDQRMGTDVIRHFIAMRVEAVLLVDIPPEPTGVEWLKMLKKRGVPTAMLEPLGPAEYNAVHLDRTDALARITQHLIGLGHRRLALFGISRRFPLGRPRFDGVVRALCAGGLNPETVLEIVDEPERRYGGLRYGQELAELWLAGPHRATAIIALNDDVAAGALWQLQKTGLHCPRDFSLFGFDNQALAGQTMPALCTVDHNVESIALAAVDLLANLIASGPGVKQPVRKIEPHVVLRESAARPTKR